jgi:hypothetical protein
VPEGKYVEAFKNWPILISFIPKYPITSATLVIVFDEIFASNVTLA